MSWRPPLLLTDLRAEAADQSADIFGAVCLDAGADLNGLGKLAAFEALVPSGLFDRDELQDIIQPQKAGCGKGRCSLLTHVFLQSAVAD